MTESNTTPRLEEACQALIAAATRVASYSHASVPPSYFQQIRAAVDDGKASLTVQVDLPAGSIRVLVDGEQWVAPQCLLNLERKAGG